MEVDLLNLWESSGAKDMLGAMIFGVMSCGMIIIVVVLGVKYVIIEPLLLLGEWIRKMRKR
jgi:hypothetical protein